MKRRFSPVYLLPLLLIVAAAGYYLYRCLARTLAFYGIVSGWLPLLLAAAALLSCFYRPIPIKARTIFIAYLLLFFLLVDAAAWLLPPLLPLRNSGVLPPLIAAALLIYAHYNAKRVVLTRYDLSTPHHLPQGHLRIALLSDIHMGFAVDEDKLRQTLELLEREQPDIFLIAGDIVDDRTSAAEMQAACRLLGQLKTPLGSYAVYGNHDLASHGPHLQFGRQELDAALKAAGITVLDDAVAELDGITLLGRHDIFMSAAPRRTLAQLQAECSRRQPQILLDHQPLELKQAADAGVMLMLSGHTHGGQLWPMGLLSSLLHMYELTYGHRQIGNSHFIVSSGLGMRGVKMRSGCRAEAVIINLVTK